MMEKPIVFSTFSKICRFFQNLLQAITFSKTHRQTQHLDQKKAGTFLEENYSESKRMVRLAARGKPPTMITARVTRRASLACVKRQRHTESIFAIFDRNVDIFKSSITWFQKMATERSVENNGPDMKLGPAQSSIPNSMILSLLSQTNS